MDEIPADEAAAAVRLSGERLVYDGPEVRVCQVDLRLADGDVLPWDVVGLGRSASVVLADELARVLLVRRYRAGLNRWGWELPGGLVEEDETPMETAARALVEQGRIPRRWPVAGGLVPARTMLRAG